VAEVAEAVSQALFGEEDSREREKIALLAAALPKEEKAGEA
jgi:hypothetical protein